MKKLFCLLLTVLCGMTFAACGGTTVSDDPDDHTETETYEEKLFDGIDAVFDESLGYYNEHPSVLQDGTTRYLFYTRNTKKYDASTDSIAVRVGTYKGGEWTYGEAKTCITVSESGWDSKSVFGADVVKGKFLYNGKEYSWLMSYSGSDRSDRMDADIGLAVAETPDGEWTKVGSEALIEFNSSEWDNVGLSYYPGCIESSLVSFDKSGKVYLFYEESEAFKSNYVYELDCSDLGAIVKGGRKVVETTGTSDLGTSNPLLYGGDFLYDPDSDSFFAAREVRTTATAEPKVADEVEVLRASADVLRRIEQGVTQEEPADWWSEVGDSIDADATADMSDQSRIFGYMRIFSPCIASDAYGYLLEYGKLEVFFTTQACEGDERLPSDHAGAYKFSQMIHTLVITY